MWLAIQFYKRGIVSAKDVCELMDYCYSNRSAIGEIAVRMRMLSVRQLFEILRAQADDHRPFGIIAQEMNLLTRAQVDELRYRQYKETLDVREGMVSAGIMTSKEFDEALSQIRASSLQEAVTSGTPQLTSTS